MQATQPAVSEKCKPGPKVIVLSVDENGNPSASPYYAEFQVGDELVWESDEDSPWAIAFHDNRTPTDAPVIQGRGKEMFTKHKAKNRGHFAYTVALHRKKHPLAKGKPAIFLEVRCPEIIID